MNADRRYTKFWICSDCATIQQLKPWRKGFAPEIGRCAWCSSLDERELLPLKELEDKNGRRADCVIFYGY